MDKIQETYRKLQEHLDSMPIGFPYSETGADIKVLKAFFTAEEAELATLLSFFPNSLKKIHSKIKDSGVLLYDLKKKLDTMVEKGLIYKEDSPIKTLNSYGNLPYAIGIFEEHVNKLTKEKAEASEEYGPEFIKEFLGEKTGVPQMRTIPINAALTHENQVMDYDSARKILDSVQGPYAVAPCVCVQSRELMGKSCKHDMIERCMVNSQAYIDNGNAREITKSEAIEILEKAEEKGLVIQPGNSKDAGGFCLCCNCCCGILRDAKTLDQPAKLFATNYYSEVLSTECTGCGTCVEFCPMDAITLNKIAQIERERCIGCGICVTKCPSEAILLRNKEDVKIPPENWTQLIAKIYRKKRELASARK